MRVGIMAHKCASQYIWPRRLLLARTAAEVGYQQWRWLNFYIVI